jgi:SpoVK/Ycf46/Vps4 family AAA+-type ATPase
MTGKQAKETREVRAGYGSNQEYLRDQFRKLDLRIRHRAIRFRQSAPASSRPDLAAVYISDEEVDHLLEPRSQDDAGSAVVPGSIERLQLQIQARVLESAKERVFLALPHLAHVFSLSPFETETLVICLAPELERKYDKLYAYLQDDITRKRPSVDLVLDLLCSSEAQRWHARTCFSPQAPLFRTGLLGFVEDLQSPSGSSDLARFLRIDPRILNYLLEANQPDATLADACRLTLPGDEAAVEPLFVEASIREELLRFVQAHFSGDPKDRRKLVVHVHGPRGVGKRALVLDLCRTLNLPVLTLDVKLLSKDDVEAETQVRRFFREGLLLQAALFLDGLESVLRTDPRGERLLGAVEQPMLQFGWLCFTAGESDWPRPAVFREVVFQSVPLPMPDVSLREMAWTHYLDLLLGSAPASWAVSLAGRFRLTGGQIRDATGFAEARHLMQGAESNLSCADLYSACRQQSNRQLSELARKIACRAGWEDLILPEAQLSQLRDICGQVRQRARVFGDWGFDRKLSYGKGLSVLFSGPPGTGKTLAAEVISRELELDCYKIDLSGLVSKYIGETEKNLSRVFQEAETSNAILFFDEADALFGKRTEISDAHDRYANIETSFLLQKMEEYEGIVILATNLRDNMDEAFTRRIRFIVEFPFPDAEQRMTIWKRHFPDEAPVNDDIDYELLSRKVQVAGGNIKNIVLNAAFLAAGNGQVIGMDHLIQGTKREYEKIGKLWDESRMDPAKDRSR